MLTHFILSLLTSIFVPPYSQLKTPKPNFGTNIGPNAKRSTNIPTYILVLPVQTQTLVLCVFVFGKVKGLDRSASGERPPKRSARSRTHEHRTHRRAAMKLEILGRGRADSRYMSMVLDIDFLLFFYARCLFTI